MAIVKVALTAFILSHLLALALIIFRLVNRLLRNRYWLDDLLAAITAFGTGLNAAILIQIVVKASVPAPLEYRLVIGGCMFIIWTSKAHSVMTLGRVVYGTYGIFWPRSTPLFLFASFLLFAVGIALNVVALLCCKIDANCSDNTPCHCNVASQLILPLSALISNSIIDAAIIGLSVKMYMLKRFRTHVARQWIVKTAIISNTTVFVVNVGIWASYQGIKSGHYTPMFTMANIAATLSALLSNVPTIVGIAKISLTGDIQNVTNNNDNQVEDIPLGATSITGAAEGSGSDSAVTVVTLGKTAGSKVLKTVRFSVPAKESDI